MCFTATETVQLFLQCTRSLVSFPGSPCVQTVSNGKLGGT